MTLTKGIVIGTAWYMAASFTYSLIYHLYLFTEPRPQAPVTKQSVVSPNPPPTCESTKEQYCDELGILVPRYAYVPSYTDTDYEDDRANDHAQQAQQHSRYDY